MHDNQANNHLPVFSLDIIHKKREKPCKDNADAVPGYLVSVNKTKNKKYIDFYFEILFKKANVINQLLTTCMQYGSSINSIFIVLFLSILSGQSHPIQ